MRKIVAFLIIICVFNKGKAIEPTIPKSGPQYYVYLGKEMELQIEVNIWGYIRNPGLYSIPKTIDLIALISLAGGPRENANLKKVKIIRTTPKPSVFMVDIDKYTKSGKLENAPILEPGDTIIIPGTWWPTLQKISTILSTIVLAGTAYYWFSVSRK